MFQLAGRERINYRRTRFIGGTNSKSAPEPINTGDYLSFPPISKNTFFARNFLPSTANAKRRCTALSCENGTQNHLVSMYIGDCACSSNSHRTNDPISRRICVTTRPKDGLHRKETLLAMTSRQSLTGVIGLA